MIHYEGKQLTRCETCLGPTPFFRPFRICFRVRGALARRSRGNSRRDHSESSREVPARPRLCSLAERFSRPNRSRRGLVAVGIDSARVPGSGMLVSLQILTKSGNWAVVVVAAGIQAFQDSLSGLADRFIGPSQWEPEVRYQPDFGPTAEQVVASLRRDGHQHVDYPMAQAYAAGVVVQRCLEAAGGPGSVALREAAVGLKFSTFFGEFQIDGETGRQTGRETLLVQWQGDRKAIVWPPEQAQGKLIYPWR